MIRAFVLPSSWGYVSWLEMVAFLTCFLWHLAEAMTLHSLLTPHHSALTLRAADNSNNKIKSFRSLKHAQINVSVILCFDISLLLSNLSKSMRGMNENIPYWQMSESKLLDSVLRKITCRSQYYRTAWSLAACHGRACFILSIRNTRITSHGETRTSSTLFSTTIQVHIFNLLIHLKVCYVRFAEMFP